MAKSKKSTTVDPMRKKLGNKASRIRSRQKLGKSVSPNDSAWLMEWDRKKDPKAAKNGASKVPTTELGGEPAGDLSDVGTKLPPDAPKPEPESSKPPPPPLPKDAPKQGGGDWRKRYGGAGESREEQCVMVAALWMKGLRRMNADISELGGTPVITDGLIAEFMLPAMVLTVDKFTPDNLDVDPTIISALGTTVVTAQRVYQGRTAAAKEKNSEKEDAQILRMVQPPPKPSEELAKDEPKEAEPQRKQASAALGIDDHEFKEGDPL